MNMPLVSNSLIAAIKKYRNILIYVKGSPDPDAIACSYAFQALCSLSGVKSEIRSKMDLSLQQNKLLVSYLGIPLQVTDRLSGLDKYDAYAVLDHPSNYEKELVDLPCCVHIDHHTISEDSISADYFLSVDEFNSLSSFFAFVFSELNLNIDRDLMRRVSTALLFGIHTDTDRLDHATNSDRAAVAYLDAFADNRFLSELMSIPYGGETMNVIRRALMSHEVYKNWVISGVGFVAESNRDAIAITADYLLEQSDFSTTVVFAIIERKNGTLFLDASFRTKIALLDLNDFIKKITSNGGARQYKGAYQVDLTYFSEYHDKAVLWDILNAITVDHIKRGRDELKFIAVTDVFSKISRRIRSIFVREHRPPFRG